MAVSHYHQHGVEHVLDLYGHEGQEFHLRVGHGIVVDDADDYERLDVHRHAHEADTVAPSDDEVEENIADAIGPVPFANWRMRTGSCEQCAYLWTLPATQEVMALIEQHAYAAHAETLVAKPLV